MRTERGDTAARRIAKGIDRVWSASRHAVAARRMAMGQKVKAQRMALIAAGALLPLSTLMSAAQTMPASPPMPPPRPAMPGDAPSVQQPSPKPSGPVQRQQDAPVPPAPPPATNGVDAPHIAPNVDRAALRACAIEWHRMKSSGAAGGLIWRDFAPGCLQKFTKPGQ